MLPVKQSARALQEASLVHCHSVYRRLSGVLSGRGVNLIRVQRLLDALRDERSTVTLDVAALEMASIEFPGLDIDASLLRLDSLAQQISAQLTANATGLDFIKAANDLLFEVHAVSRERKRILRSP